MHTNDPSEVGHEIVITLYKVIFLISYYLRWVEAGWKIRALFEIQGKQEALQNTASSWNNPRRDLREPILVIENLQISWWVTVNKLHFSIFNKFK